VDATARGDRVVKPEAISLEGDVDAAIEPYVSAAIATLEDRAPLLGEMARHHLGYGEANRGPAASERRDRGKRMRPAIALLAAGAAGGSSEVAAPLAAAVELLHNFTLVHDDVQDQSPTRRHRPTVWSLWGIGQAINAGDALFAAAHLPLYTLPERDISPVLTLRLLAAFDRMTIAIVAGQTLDLGFEGRSDTFSADYLTMITGKTAAIVRFAAWAGSLLGGATDDAAERWADFGLALGLGFQIRDDLLGIWGAAETTGKAAADDIRRRKQTLPMLLLRERLDVPERAELARIFAASEVDAAGVERVLSLLERERAREAVEAEIARYHDRAAAALREAAMPGPNPSRDRLVALVDRLSTRDG
jgi:geranylgeranyl diphosphate synthase type I